MNAPNLDNWADFSGDFLKVADIKAFPLVVVPTEVSAEYDKDNKPKLSFSCLYAERTRKLGLNKTNQSFIKNAGISPKGIIGKKLTFDKCKVRDPSKNALVDGFALVKIE